MPLLPNLLLIGAPKSGTTSLHEYLALHPEIAMSRRKELKFFTRDDWREKVGWYEAQFPDSARVRGESSPGYTMFPYLPSVAERAHELIPDAKLIYLVRDPVDRALANYVEFVALGFETRPIEEALADVDDPANPHVCASRYASQLDRFLRLFEPGKILVLDAADLLRHREHALRETFEFLGVDPMFKSPEFERTYNTGDAKVRYNALGWWMVQHGILTTRRRPSRRGPLVRPLRQLLSKPIDTTLSASTREFLVAVFCPEVSRLRELTGKPLANWPSFPAEAPLAGIRPPAPPH
jgi:hypothetical protein